MVSKQQREPLRWKYVAIVALPIAAFIVSEALVAVFAQAPVIKWTGLVEQDPSNVIRWSEAASRLQLLAMALLYLLAAIAVLLKFGMDLVRERERAPLLVAYAVCVVAGAVVLLLAYRPEMQRTTIDLLGKPLFTEAFKQVAALEPGLWGECAFMALLHLVNATSVLAVPALVVGGISALTTLEPSEGPSEEQNWKCQVDRFKTYLYISTSFLALGVIYIRTWTSYPAFFLKDKSSREAYDGLVNAYTMFTGIEFSLVLAAFALPVAWLLSLEGDRIVRQMAAAKPSATVTEERIQEIRADKKLVFSASDSFRVILALLAPLITGALPSLTSAVS